MFGKQIAAAAVLAVLLFVMPGSVLGDCPGDMNNDNVVDFADAQVFLGCMLGANVPVDAGCEAADIDLDSDADMSDFGVLQAAFGSQCGPQEIVLRNSIGPNNSTTNGNWPIHTTKPQLGDWWEMVTEVAVPEALSLSSVRVVIAQTGSFLDFGQLAYRVRVWNTYEEAASSPLVGSIADVQFSVPSIGPNLHGQTFNMPIFGIRPTWELAFDLSPADIQLTGGHSVIIGFQVESGGSTSGGILGLLESTEENTTDMYIRSSTPGVYSPVDQLQHSLHYGRMAFDVRGVAD